MVFVICFMIVGVCHPRNRRVTNTRCLHLCRTHLLCKVMSGTSRHTVKGVLALAAKLTAENAQRRV